MKPTYGTLALAFGLGLAIGCGALFAGHYPARFDADIEGPPEQVPWTGLEPAADPDEFRFAVVTDRTGGHRDGVFEAAMGKLNLVRPEFVVSVGDLIEGYETRPDPVLRLFAGGLPEGALQAERLTQTGHSVEVAIPTKLLDERRGARWDALRLNVSVNDFDEGEPDSVTLSWRPSRFEPGAIEGAGTFLRR